MGAIVLVGVGKTTLVGVGVEVGTLVGVGVAVGATVAVGVGAIVLVGVGLLAIVDGVGVTPAPFSPILKVPTQASLPSHSFFFLFLLAASGSLSGAVGAMVLLISESLGITTNEPTANSPTTINPIAKTSLFLFLFFIFSLMTGQLIHPLLRFCSYTLSL